MSISNLLADNKKAWLSIKANDVELVGDNIGIELNDLDDVNMPAPATGTLMVYNGSEYVQLNAGSPAQFLTPSPLFPNGIGWIDINDFRALAHMYFTTNFGAPLVIPITVINQWEPITGLTQGELLNTTFNASIITVGVNVPGVYQISGGASYRNTGVGTDLTEFGVGINGSVPVPANSLGGQDIATLWASSGFSTIVRVNGGDTLRLYARNLSTTDNIEIAALQFSIVKIAN
jgi:hypothetical protein